MSKPNAKLPPLSIDKTDKPKKITQHYRPLPAAANRYIVFNQTLRHPLPVPQEIRLNPVKEAPKANKK